jgi:hypothetical protein
MWGQLQLQLRRLITTHPPALPEMLLCYTALQRNPADQVGLFMQTPLPAVAHDDARVQQRAYAKFLMFAWVLVWLFVFVRSKLVRCPRFATARDCTQHPDLREASQKLFQKGHKCTFLQPKGMLITFPLQLPSV